MIVPRGCPKSMTANKKTDVLVVGGGVVGLSVAYELARQGVEVTLLERGRLGGEASWAGAGMLPPGSWYSEHAALDDFAKLAKECYPTWSEELLELSGINNEFWVCGGRYDKSSANDMYCQRLNRWRDLGIQVEEHEDHFWVPEEAQIRNPRHIKALQRSCEALGTTIYQKCDVKAFNTTPDGVKTVIAIDGSFDVGSVVITAGCWSSPLVKQLGLNLPSRPLRGQMLLLRPEQMTLPCNRHRYPFYLVPRRDGLLLVGATVEYVGFDRRTTKEAFHKLLDFARDMDPLFRVGNIEGFWSGLRPDSLDGLPTIGRVPGWQNVWLATGHSRAGFQFALPTAKLIAAQILGQSPLATSDPFSPNRFHKVATVSC